MGQVIMRHKETKGVSLTTDTAFENTYKAKNWELLDASNTSAEELREIADDLGISLPEKGSKQDLVAAITTAANVGEEETPS